MLETHTQTSDGRSDAVRGAGVRRGSNQASDEGGEWKGGAELESQVLVFVAGVRKLLHACVS